MLPYDLMVLSTGRIWRNRRRYAVCLILTSLGISGLIILLSTGSSLEKSIAQELELLGKANIIRIGWDFEKRPRWHHGEFSYSDLKKIKELHAVRFATAFTEKSDQVFHHPRNKVMGTLIGVDENFNSALDLRLKHGRGISAQDVVKRQATCVLGSEIVLELFGQGTNPLGANVWIEGLAFRVVGILGGAEHLEFIRSVQIPISVASNYVPGMEKITGIYVLASDWDEVSALRQSVREALCGNRAGRCESLEINYFPEKIETIKDAVLLVKALLYSGLLAVLLLATLGIAAIMIAAVQERTREIGLKKALGARNQDIMAEFIAEALSVSLFGALCGVCAALLGVNAFKYLIGTSVNTGLLVVCVVAGLTFGGVAGTIAGYVPARDAAQLDPVSAMRFE
jgi:putative ABC transport system permease protein